MVLWRFLNYVTQEGVNPIQEWYAEQDEAVRAALDFTIHQLKVIDDWVNPERKQFSLLTGKHAGLGELRFWPSDDERKFRVAGLYRPTDREFVMLVGCEKWFRGRFYKPTGAFSLAMKYKGQLDDGKGHTIEHV